MAKRLRDGIDNVAKCEVAKETLVLGVKFGIHRVHLEGDSEIIANKIKKGKLEA